MPSNLERRGNTLHAVLFVPKDLQHRLGRTKFSESLDTTDKRQAEVLKLPLLATWRAMIRRERGHGDSLKAEALRMRALLAELERAAEATGYEEDETSVEAFQDHIVSRAEEHEKKRGTTSAKQFAAIALGDATPSDIHFAAWHAQLHGLAQKTQDQMRSDVGLMLKRFPTLEEINAQSVARWMHELAQAGASDSSRARIASFCRSYWRYLQSPAISAVKVDPKPFAGLSLKKKRNGSASRRGWTPFEPNQVVSLWKAARDIGDAQLADLIMLGAHTGARIEELCSLKLENVTARAFLIKEGKTDAATREVPIHSAIQPLVKRLKSASTDGYLLTSLTFNKYDDRSNAIGKRFGRLKTAQGFGEQHVFHSIRKTLVTMLENGGVSENLAADIVGHEKPRITYGLYSGGVNLKGKAEAIARVRYPLGKAKIA